MNTEVKGLDKTSFELLFKEHFKGMCLFAMRYVKDIETARGIAQDAFVSLWEKRESIDMSKPVKSYLTTIVYNRSLNHLRDNKKFDRNIVSFEHLETEREPESDQRVLSRELDALIEQAIMELPEKCREIFLLSRKQNLKYQEIADTLGLSVKTVEAQMSKALQHMRTRLSAYLSLLLVLMITGHSKFLN